VNVGIERDGPQVPGHLLYHGELAVQGALPASRPFMASYKSRRRQHMQSSICLACSVFVQAVKSLTGIIGTRRHQERKQNKRKLYYSQNRACTEHVASNTNQTKMHVKMNQQTQSTNKRKKQNKARPTRSRRKRKKS
jgi:hypothetical protein